METNENNNQEDVVFEPPTNQVANQFEEKDLDEGEVFRLLTPKLLGEFEEMRAERKKRVKEAKNKQIVIKERIVDGEIVYENEENEEDEEIVYNDDYDDTDTTLTEGNLVPARLGLIPKKILQKPAIEIDPFIHKRLQVIKIKYIKLCCVHLFILTELCGIVKAIQQGHHSSLLFNQILVSFFAIQQTKERSHLVLYLAVTLN